MPYETSLFGIDHGIARLTLNRPDKLNSFNTRMHAEVRQALDEVRRGAARVLVLTGAGRGFCAGQDLQDRAVAPGGQTVDLGDSIENSSMWSAMRSATSAARPTMPRESPHSRR